MLFVDSVAGKALLDAPAVDFWPRFESKFFMYGIEPDPELMLPALKSGSPAVLACDEEWPCS